jgi:acyl-coenzyme A thioesterase PaaI-like protein
MKQHMDVTDQFIHDTLSGKDGFERWEMHHSRDRDELKADLVWGKGLRGHPGLAHGGSILASLDELLGTLFYVGKHGKGFTARLEADFRRPLPIGAHVEFVGRVIEREGRKVWLRGVLRQKEDPSHVYVECKALFVVARQVV